jgi:hypothetical protein
MNRTNLFAAVALALGVFACERNADRASETKTTSAAQPADTSGTTTPAPVAPADTSMNINVDAKDGGRAPSTLGLEAKDGGHRATGTQTGADGPDHARAPLDRNKNTVAPGHITTPPDHGRATGAPNSDGSHDIGAGGSPTR